MLCILLLLIEFRNELSCGVGVIVVGGRVACCCRCRMTSWAERMHRRAATFSNVVTSCGHPSVPYPRRLEKVKFGVPLDEVCKNDIPGPLLVLILKLNKEAPFKKDVFRAPGHQGNMKKLIHFLQAGRLVNMDNFSVYTIASVLKKFLRKLPGGIFGRDGEQRLFAVIDLPSTEEQRDQIHRLITSLPTYTQRLLVLLFGTFRVIATNAERARTGMTSEALGVSVAPSFFQSCVSDGKTAKMEDVMRFKVATRIMKFLIDNFGVSNLFGRENYEFYARITGRILKVEEDWIFSFRYPPDTLVSPMSHQEESQSTPALIHVPEGYDPDAPSTSLGIIPENNLLESYTRLSISLEENGLFKGSSRSSSSSATTSHHMTLEELRAVNRYAESTKSLSYLPQVHERQTARMRTRSEWFLTPVDGGEGGKLVTCSTVDSDPTSIHVLRGSNTMSSSGNIVGAGLSASAESVKRPSIRRSSSRSDKSRHLPHRSSSRRKNKENGAKQVSQPSGIITQSQRNSGEERKLDEGRGGKKTVVVSGGDDGKGVMVGVTPQDCTEMDVQTFHVTLTYKPRI
ncbi:T-cell activation Rho GTPase-activating protein isoform X2 [Periplaneta americana]|uniref:T-cell activation Rho GTPase-activating protein isoform X2 n=1 Tax=Periplaneta americana TaxID=6978 RepID=UPI0037E827C6